jgi:hypothetical protein
VIFQESRPPFGRLRISRGLPHPSEYGSFRNLETKHLQLAMNSRCTPGAILGYHPEDEIAHFATRGFPSYANVFARNPFPIQLESGPMPVDDRLRPHNNKRSPPTGPKSPQQNPKDPVGYTEARPRMSVRQGGELLSQGQVLQKKIASASQDYGCQYHKMLQKPRHG